jgi:small subunit ribosomal protein S18
MARERRSKSAAADRRRPQKKKVSILNTESIDWIDYKDVNLLRRFMSERAKIRARRVTGNSAQQQREVAKAIRLAREMALLPYSVRQVTQRKGGRRDRDDRGERGDRGLREPREERGPRDDRRPDAGLPADAAIDTPVSGAGVSGEGSDFVEAAGAGAEAEELS